MNELLILSRAVHFGSCLLLVSGFAVRLLAGDRQAPGEEGATRRMAGGCLLAAMGSGFVWFWAAAANMSGSGMMEALDPQLFRTVIEQTAPGQVWVARLGIALVIGVVLVLPPRKWTWWTGAVLAAGLDCTLAWLGHAGAGEDGERTIMLINDSIHLLAAALWPAGLLPLALVLRRRMKSGLIAAAHEAVRRFSTMSLVTVAMLAVTGMVNSYFLIGSVHALVTNNYGRLLVVKVTVFAVAVTLGACNLLLHKPRLESDPAALAALARKVWVEVALGALIVAVVAVLGTLPPAISAGR